LIKRRSGAFLQTFAAGLLAGASGVAYARCIMRRNAALVRPRVSDGSGGTLAESRFEYSDGETVEFIDAGAGDVLVWIPGADGPKETFRYQLPRFAGDYRVVCADLRASFAADDDFDRFVEDLLELLDALEQVERPFLMHCKSGADRVGLASVLYLLHMTDTPVALAKKQLGLRYLHIRASSTGILDHMIDAYQADNAARQIPIRDWIEQTYDPDALSAQFHAKRGKS